MMTLLSSIRSKVE